MWFEQDHWAIKVLHDYIDYVTFFLYQHYILHVFHFDSSISHIIYHIIYINMSPLCPHKISGIFSKGRRALDSSGWRATILVVCCFFFDIYVHHHIDVHQKCITSRFYVTICHPSKFVFSADCSSFFFLCYFKVSFVGIILVVYISHHFFYDVAPPSEKL